MPQATAREFARSIAAVAEQGLSEREEPELAGADGVQVLALDVPGARVDHVFVLGLRAVDRGLERARCEPVPDALLREPLPAMTTPRAAHACASVCTCGLTSARAGGAGVRRRRDGRAVAPLAAIEASAMRSAVSGST